MHMLESIINGANEYDDLVCPAKFWITSINHRPTTYFSISIYDRKIVIGRWFFMMIGVNKAKWTFISDPVVSFL